MNTKKAPRVSLASTSRPVALAVAAILSQGAAAGSLTVNLSNVTVQSTGAYTYNSGAAVCAVNKDDGIAVSAKATAVFTQTGLSSETVGKCTEDKGAGYWYKEVTYTDTQTKTSVGVTAEDAFNTTPVALLGGTPPTYTGSLASPLADNQYNVTVRASASEVGTVTPYTYRHTYSDNKCTTFIADTAAVAGKVSEIDNSGKATDTSAYYYVDLAAPTQTHNVKVSPVMQLTDLNLNIHTAGGSSEQDYYQRAGFNDGSADIWGDEAKFTFGKSFNDGIASSNTEAAGVLVSCSVPVDTGYTSKAQLTSTNDLCGQAYAPPAIDSTSKGGSALFDVTENPDCSGATNQAIVTAPLPPASLGTDPGSGEESYALVACYTSQNAGSVRKPKIVSYPGTIHLGTVINSAGDGSSCDDPVMVDDIVFSADDDQDFEFLKTGNSPQAHVFVGIGNSIWYHTGYPLTEIDSRLISISVSVDKHELTMHLGGTELGCGLGALPKGATLYARAHAKFVGPDLGYDKVHTFYTDAVGMESTATIVENPNETCTDGQLPLPP